MQFCASAACQFNGRAGSSHSFLSTSASPGPLSHALAHSPDHTHYSLSSSAAPPQRQWDVVTQLFLLTKKKKKELQSQMTPQLQNRKPCIILTELWQSSASKTGNWQEKKALKKTKKQNQMFLNNKCGLEQYAKVKNSLHNHRIRQRVSWVNRTGRGENPWMLHEEQSRNNAPLWSLQLLPRYSSSGERLQDIRKPQGTSHKTNK